MKLFQSLLKWARDKEETSAATDAEDRERRMDVRHDFTGAQLPIRDRKLQSTLHLKDLSCRGACGITDMPIAVGAVLFMQVQKPHYHAAEVRWVRNSLIGLQFIRPLDLDRVEKMVEAHAKRGAG